MNLIYKFEFVSVFWRYDALLSASGNIIHNVPGYCFTETFIPLNGNRRFRVGWVEQQTGVFYDANYNVLDYWGTNHNYADGIVTAPNNSVYIRAVYRTTLVENGTAYIGNMYSNDNWITSRICNPVYKDDLAKEFELETNQRFYRTKLSGKISFIRDDYDYINNQPFETQFQLLIRKSNDGGRTWGQNYFKGKFFKTDCEFDADNKKCTVQPDPLDDYNDVLAGLEKEYNLITLAPKINRVLFDKRPLIQIYIPGDSVVSCFLGGDYWEQDANAVSDRNALINTYYFALCNLLKEINVTGSSNPNVNGLYAGRMSIGANNTFTGTLYPNNNNGFTIRASQEYQPPFFGIINYEIVRTSDNVVLFSYSRVSSGNQPWDNAEFDFTAVSGSGASGTPHAEMTTYNIYARYLCDVEKINDLTTYQLPTDDIVENNRNYHRAIGYAIDVGYISNNFSAQPTEYGLADNGQYFAPPYSIWGQKFFPIARSTWRYASIWFGFALFDWILEEKARKQYTLRDAYPVASCISVLLKQFAPGISHEATAEYSQFLYGATNPISHQKFELLLTQKTNVLVGDYDRPAQKAPTTLQQLTNMLRDCFRCFWYIEDGKFKVENILWFRNGGSYSANPGLTVDLTTLLNVRNGKTWGFASSKWSFDKVDMAERYQFEWMDDVTQPFEGSPINILSKFVTPGKIEEITVSNFTSDVDYMILNPSAISEDGFALFAAVRDSNNNLVLPYRTFSAQGVDFVLQNYILSFYYLQPTYYVYDLPARRVEINGSSMNAYGVERKKKQTVTYPSIDDPDPMKLVKTPIGSGQINKISITLHSRMNKVTLMYDTE